MATRKSKHARALAKREEFLANVKQTGLQAQRKDREERERKMREAWKDQHEKKHSWKKRIKECPLCGDEIKAAKQISQELMGATA